jgi:hypothetical protein
MCVAEAEIVFEAFEIKSLTFNEKGVYDINDNCIKSIPRREASLSECMSILINAAKGYCWILGMHMEETAADGKHGFAADFSIVTDDDVFDLLFEFDHVVISWDRFSGKAWYEESPWRENAPNRP